MISESRCRYPTPMESVIMKRSVLASCVMCLLLTVAVSAFGQKKPPSSVENSKPAANDGGTKAPPPTQGKIYAPSEELIEEFRDAVEKDNFPKVLMLVRQAPLMVEQANEGARGIDVVGPEPVSRDATPAPLNFDHTGITDVLENALGVYLQEGFEEFVDPSSLETDELAEMIHNNIGRDEVDGLTAIAQKLNAEVVIYIRFLELHPAERPLNNERFRCTAEIKHLRRLTSRKVASFDWDGPIDVRNARRYAGALAEEFMKQYIAMVRNRAIEVSIRMERLPGHVTNNQVCRWLTMEGVSGKPKVLDTTTGPDQRITVEGRVRYRGDTSVIEDAIRQSARADGVELAVIKNEQTRIILESHDPSATGAITTTEKTGAATPPQSGSSENPAN